MRSFADQIVKGDNISSEAMQVAAYGIYLMHGGTPEGYEKLTPEDINIMYITYQSMRSASNLELINGIIEIVKAVAP